MRAAHYLVKDGNKVVGYITSQQFFNFKKEGRISFYNGDPRFPMLLDDENKNVSLSPLFLVHTNKYEMILDVYGEPNMRTDSVPTLGSIKIERTNPGMVDSYPTFKLTGIKTELIDWLEKNYDEDEDFFNQHAVEVK